MQTERTCTAMYETRGAAEAARDGVRVLGVTDDAIAISGAEGVAHPDVGQDMGLLASIVDLFVPEEDQRLYTEGVQRGAFLVTVRAPARLEDRVTEALERAEPMDLDSRPLHAVGGREAALPTEITDRVLSMREGDAASGVTRDEAVFPAGPDSMLPVTGHDEVAAGASSRRRSPTAARVRRYDAARPDHRSGPDSVRS
ncbi:MAG: hypothetical protein U1E14_15595 [Geminicoccaceae bacterium]